MLGCGLGGSSSGSVHWEQAEGGKGFAGGKGGRAAKEEQEKQRGQAGVYEAGRRWDEPGGFLLPSSQ